MNEFENFLFVNRIKGKEIAEYLQVSNAFVSMVRKGEKVLPQDKKELLLTNENGWDVSMLTSECGEDEGLTFDVKQLRESLNKTQDELAKLVGVHYRTIQNWESGGIIPKSKYAILSNLATGGIHQNGNTNVIGDSNNIGDGAKDEMIDILRKEVDKLLGELEEQREINRRYLTIIENLSKKEQ